MLKKGMRASTSQELELCRCFNNVGIFGPVKVVSVGEIRFILSKISLPQMCT